MKTKCKNDRESKNENKHKNKARKKLKNDEKQSFHPLSQKWKRKCDNKCGHAVVCDQIVRKKWERIRYKIESEKRRRRK